ncbi:hypothetical protein [Cellulosilyticum lentocellum]|uniref:Uncharacterized protein n=1 Tax=Cellulosilyticum lentocellum (strain ATCC 49066 / DSM 5427 / NCIMB 11756 / RHM5) TaxID=642492 RepID=F2JRX7_CELLD|nr:hypothetical protein [Cellulosilyticum lentocellum]ADZ82791.1 hypothetical protein Clole_1060 [Cellulosilyticum lentocellum DSM 5427]
MLIFLLIFEIAIILITILSHIMLEKKYKEIERSTHIYTNKRAYRTEESIAFIDDIIKRYQKFTDQENESPDVYSMIKSSLLKEYIGKFTFIGVNNVAHKSKYVMWGIIVLEMAIGYINNVTTSFEGVVVIISSILLAIGAEMYIIIKALEEKKEAIIVSVEDYILNAYPLHVNKEVKVNNIGQETVLEKEQTKELVVLTQAKNKALSYVISEDKEDKKDKKDKKGSDTNKYKIESKEGLTERDIIGFINNLNKL